mmetsp:Transcript_62051/g.145910  ORF Transcript_62051/g.145910 Transcript_62051/m.145910 type:complete len:241 (+) Transcript_62051:252-974(+)
MSFPVAESDNNCCPRANSCCFCISLRLGVYLIALFDTAFSFLKVVGCILVLSQPQILLSYAEQTSDDGQPRSSLSEYDLGVLRASLILAAGSVFFGFKGALATRTCDPEGLRTYLNWKVLSVVMTMIISAMVHKVWWSGCGLLSEASCADLKAQLVVGSLVAVIPGLYFVWKIWSLWALLHEADEFLLYNAGYNDEDLERLRLRAAHRRYANCDPTYPYEGLGQTHSPGSRVQPNTTYLV